MSREKEALKKYAINNNGTIVSDDPSKKSLSIQTCRAGYKVVYLTVNGKRGNYSVARLVATKYVKGRTRWRCEVNHIDGDKSNNHYSNLEWVTRKENMQHSRKVLKNKSGKPRKEIRNQAILDLYNMGWSQDKLALAFGVSQPRIAKLTR